MGEAYDRKKAGDRLRARRKALNLTRKEAAERIGRAQKYYADIERGTCGMSVGTLIALSKAYGMPLEEILYGEKGMEETKCFGDRAEEAAAGGSGAGCGREREESERSYTEEEAAQWSALLGSLGGERRRAVRELLEKVMGVGEG